MRLSIKVAVSLIVAASLLLTGATGSFASEDETASGSEPTGSAMSDSEAPMPEARSMAAATAAAVNPTATKIALPAGLKGFDNIGVDSPTQLNCLSAAGYSFDVVDALGAGWDTEYRSAAAIGMSIVLFQGFYQPFWSDPAQGTARGQLMVTNAKSVGYPKGAQVFLNLENNLTDGTNPVTRATIIAWVRNWVSVVKAAGYQAGIYVGVPQVLTTADLNSISNVVFWRSASGSAPQVSRGYVMRQPTISTTVCNDVIDVDTSGSDNRGVALVGAGFARTAPSASAAGAFVPLTPARIVDTRIDGSGAVPGSTNRTVRVLGAGGVPASNVSAVVVNVTVTNVTAPGNVVVYPTGSARPNASNLNFTVGQTVPNLVVVPVGSGGTIQVYNAASGSLDVVADVAGYYLGGTPQVAGAFAALAPSRIVDSRDDGRGPVASLGTRTVRILGAGGVPQSGVSAVVINLTVTDVTAPGNLVAYPTGTKRPNSSNLNFVAGQTVPNLVVVPVGPDGTIQAYNSAGASVDIVGDVAGYFLAGTPTAAGTLGPLSPARIMDTRSDGVGPVAAMSGRALQVTGRGGVPATGVSGVVMNVTVTNTSTYGNIRAYPSGVNQPTSSNLNFVSGQTVPNLVVVPVGQDGKVILFNAASAPVDLIADVVGYVVG